MTGQDLNRIQSTLALTDADLLTLLNGTLERKYNGTRLREWKQDERPVPKIVASLLENLTLERGLGLDDTAATDSLDDTVEQLLREEAGDTAPGVGGAAAEKTKTVALLAGGKGAYTKTCVDLWQIVGLGVSSTGALMGSAAIVVDGQIIDADAQALGEAWGKLAEQNQVFARWLMQASMGGAWLQVVLATGGTMAKIVQNHAAQAGLGSPEADGAGVPAAA